MDRTNPQTAVINFSNTGDNTVIAAQTIASGKLQSVWGIWFTVTTATNIIFKDGAGAVSGTLNMQANGSFFWAPNTWFPFAIISPGNAFIMNQSGTSSVQGMVYFTPQ